MTERILITGAAGRIGSALRPLLARPERVLRLLDINPVKPGEDDAEILTASYLDPAAIDEACAGVDAVVHLGGKPGEGPWSGSPRPTSRAPGGAGSRGAARGTAGRAGLQHPRRRVLDEGRRRAGRVPPGRRAARPDTYYGVSKAAVEALGSLYHSRFGIDVSCLRLGAYRPEPLSDVDLAVWISHEDGARLVQACLAPRRRPGSGSCGASRPTPGAGSHWPRARRSATGPRTTPSDSQPGSTESPPSTGRTRYCTGSAAASAPCRWGDRPSSPASALSQATSNAARSISFCPYLGS